MASALVNILTLFGDGTRRLAAFWSSDGTITSGTEVITPLSALVDTSNTPIGTSANPLFVTPTAAPGPAGSLSTYAALGGIGNALLTAAPVQVKGAAGGLFGVNFVNKGNFDAYVQVFDSLAAGVTLGVTVPKMSLWVPAGGAWEEKYTDEAIAFATGITIAATTTTTGAGAPVTGVQGNIFFK